MLKAQQQEDDAIPKEEKTKVFLTGKPETTNQKNTRK